MGADGVARLFTPGAFRWLTGIEDTCVYAPARYGMPPLDEFALTGHDDRWRDDLRLAVDLGSEAIRYGVGWPRVHIAPGRFEWRGIDERMAFAADLGLDVVADLVHYGTPTWLDASFADPGYVDAVTAYAAAFAERYRGTVRGITPLNEPLTTASFAGLRGVWPPALTGWAGWTRVTVAIAEGIAAASRAIRAADPGMAIVHVEAGALYRTEDPALDEHVRLLRMLADVPTALAFGRLDPSAREWLARHGADAPALDRIAARPAAVDVLGVNYYPDLTPRVLVGDDGTARQRTEDLGGAGLEAVLRSAERWGLPLVITETSIEGDERARTEWLRTAADTALRLQGEGLDLRGLTWWPLLDFVDWSWSAGGRNVEEFAVPEAAEHTRVAADGRLAPYLRRMGIVPLGDDLSRIPDGSGRLFTELATRDRATTA